MVPDLNRRQKIKWETRKGNEIGTQEINSDLNSQTQHERTTKLIYYWSLGVPNKFNPISMFHKLRRYTRSWDN